MKYSAIGLTIIAISLLSSCALKKQSTTNKYSDEPGNSRNLDPRQFISVYSIDDKDNKSLIWKYSKNSQNENDSNVVRKSNRRRRIIGTSNVVQIEFDKFRIAKQKYFKGNITIEGKIISKKGGENPVEVLPYTKIGERIETVGFANGSALEIASVYTNLLIESSKLINEIRQKEIEKLSKLNTYSQNLDLILTYIKYIRTSGEKAEKAFLSLTQLDHIRLRSIQEQLTNTKEEITEYFNTKSKGDSALMFRSNFNNEFLVLRDIDIPSTDQTRIRSIINNSISILEYLTRIEGTKIDQFLKNYPLNDLQNITKTKLLSDLQNNGHYEKLTDSIAFKAGEILYQNLNYATVNLLNEGGQEGDYLYLYVVLVKKEIRNEKVQVIKEFLPIGSYELKDTKWNIGVLDSFTLIHRLNEPSSDTTGVSPSNFKGSPGVSLLFTRRNDGDYDKNKFWNFLEPSIGVNVSYVDFSVDDDVEIGSGLVLGLFNNKILFTGGINLNNTGSGESNPFYFGIGFSFANLASKLLKDK